MNYRDEPFFPIQTETRDAQQALFTNKIIGGVSRLEYFALTIFAGMMANPTRKITHKTRASAIEQAEKLIAELKERASDS